LLLAILAAEKPVRTAAERLFADSAGPLGQWMCLAVFLSLLGVVSANLVGMVEPPLPTFNSPAGPATAGEMRQGEVCLGKGVQRELLAAYGAPTERQTLRLIVGGVNPARCWARVAGRRAGAVVAPPVRTRLRARVASEDE
jgi:hypothetical protein